FRSRPLPFSRLQPRGTRPAVRRRRSLWLESLEDRVVPATINWANPSGGKWKLRSNWVGGQVAGANDDAVISTTSSATITIQASDSLAVHGVTTDADDSLSITGSLTIGGSTSTLSGPLTISNGSLDVDGAGATVTVDGATTISGADLVAQGG